MTCQPQEFSADELTAEQWRVIPGFPDYDASTLGRIRSRKSQRSKILRFGDTGDGYAMVNLRRDGKTVPRTVHTLVLDAFAGTCPEGMLCRHFPDKNRRNNRLANLAWGTRVENSADRLCGAPTHDLCAYDKACLVYSEAPIDILARVFRVSRSYVVALRMGTVT